MKTFLLLIDGPTGVGKTTASEIVHKTFPRTALIGMDRIKWSVSGFKRDKRNNEIINKVVLAMTKTYLQQGINVIVEQGFRDGWLEMYQKLGRELKVRTITISLIAPKETLLKRIDERNKKVPHPKNIPPVLHSRVLRNIKRHKNKTPVESTKIDAVENDASKVAKKITQTILGQV